MTETHLEAAKRHFGALAFPPSEQWTQGVENVLFSLIEHLEESATAATVQAPETTDQAGSTWDGRIVSNEWEQTVPPHNTTPDPQPQAQDAPTCEHWWKLDNVSVMDKDLEAGFGVVFECSKCHRAKYAGLQMMSAESGSK